MNVTVLFDNSYKISNRLEQLGVSESALREAVNQGHLQRSRLTENHPANFHGLVMWGDSVAGLRDQLRPLGWGRKDRGSFALTVHEELGIAIQVMSGDEATGVHYLHPTNRSKKGPNTVEAVEANQQMELFESLLIEQQGSVDENQTWVLLHHTDYRAREIRMEFSRPTSISHDGKVLEWAERIILNSIPLDDDLIEIESPSGPDIDISVRRKA